MVRLHRHQLAHLAPQAWDAVLASPREPAERDCLAYWRDAGHPLVVTQQACGFNARSPCLALGVSAPARWGRRRIGLRVPASDVLYFDEFPTGAPVAAVLPARARPAWQRLCAGLRRLGTLPRAYGSYGWQAITGASHAHGGSDLDLWVPAATAEEADDRAALLASFATTGIRLDGELLFNGDTGMSWREWQAWRAGSTSALLVKTLTGARLVRTTEELGLAPAEMLP